MKVDWSETAVEQIEAIRAYLERSSLAYATTLCERIIERAEGV